MMGEAYQVHMLCFPRTPVPLVCSRCVSYLATSGRGAIHLPAQRKMVPDSEVCGQPICHSAHWLRKTVACRGHQEGLWRPGAVQQCLDWGRLKVRSDKDSSTCYSNCQKWINFTAKDDREGPMQLLLLFFTTNSQTVLRATLILMVSWDCSWELRLF